MTKHGGIIYRWVPFCSLREWPTVSASMKEALVNKEMRPHLERNERGRPTGRVVVTIFTEPKEPYIPPDPHPELTALREKVKTIKPKIFPPIDQSQWPKPAPPAPPQPRPLTYAEKLAKSREGKTKYVPMTLNSRNCPAMAYQTPPPPDRPGLPKVYDVWKPSEPKPDPRPDIYGFSAKRLETEFHAFERAWRQYDWGYGDANAMDAYDLALAARWGKDLELYHMADREARRRRYYGGPGINYWDGDGRLWGDEFGDTAQVTGWIQGESGDSCLMTVEVKSLP